MQTQKNNHGANGESSDDLYIYIHIFFFFFFFLFTLWSTFAQSDFLLQVNSASSLNRKVVPWCKASSSRVSRQWRRETQKTIFFLFLPYLFWHGLTPPSISAPHNRLSPEEQTMCVWMCICVLCVLFPDMVFSCYQHAHNSPGLISKVFFQNSRFWCWYNVATEWKSYLHADVFCKKRRLIGIFTSIYPFYQQREQVCIYACQPQWEKASWIILQQTHTHGLVRTQTLPTRLILHSYTACKK